MPPSDGAPARVKAYPGADVYRRGQGAHCAYISGFKTDMFRSQHSAVGYDFNQIRYFFLPLFLFHILSPVLLRDSPSLFLFLSLSFLSRFKTSMSLPALG